MKTWNCQIKSENELTKELMFKEIMTLRNEAATLATLLYELAESVRDSESMTPYLKTKAKQCLDLRKSFK